MKPESLHLLNAAQGQLSEGRAVLTINSPELAGRAAYLAALLAARAFIHERTGRERTGRIAKTHRGTRVAFLELTAGGEAFDREQRGFLAWAYRLKTIADYEVAPRRVVSSVQASTALDTAARFVPRIAAVLEDRPDA